MLGEAVLEGDVRHKRLVGIGGEERGAGLVEAAVNEVAAGGEAGGGEAGFLECAGAHTQIGGEPGGREREGGGAYRK